MDTILSTKLVLHIPHYAWKDGRLLDIDLLTFNKRLYAGLAEIGLESWYVTPARGFYKGRDYAEELLTVFCHEDQRDTIIEVFRRTFFENQDIMRQEAFAYECDGELIVVDLAT